MLIKNEEKSINMLVIICRTFAGIITTFGLIGCLIHFHTLIPTIKKIEINTGVKDIKGTDLLISILRSENHYLFSNQKHKDISIPQLTFTHITNINPSNLTSLLGREIPGLDIYNTEIVVAGKGTTLSNLPVESPPKSDDEILRNPQVNRNVVPKDTPKNDTKPSLTNKVVYIYHSHSWESFLPLINGATKPDDATSTNNQINIVAVGQDLSVALNDKGIGTEHNTGNMGEELHKQGWNYNQSYLNSRQDIQEVIKNDKELKYFIDIHRDSKRRKDTTININGDSYARISFVIGKANKNYSKNLELAKNLNTRLEKIYPGLSRGIFLKGKNEGNGVYNQDISTRAFLIEVGGVDNNLKELDNSMKAFAKVFSDYYWQAEEVNGQ